MKKQVITILAIAGTVYSCSPGKKSLATDPFKEKANSLSDTTMVVSPADGRSFETAVLIKERTESKGIHAEYVWIGDHYANFKIVRQALNTQKKKPYDIITIEFRDGSRQEIYFDISRYYGHF